MLTLWVAVVAERLGFGRREAFTLGRTVAGLNAHSKGRARGERSIWPRSRGWPALRASLLVIGCLIAASLAALPAGCSAGRRAAASAEPDAGPETASPAAAASPDAARVDFEIDVLPILEGGCRPCHFPGGKVHEEMPFDRPETIRRLGTRLFTRIKDEGQRATIRAFLELPADR